LRPEILTSAIKAINNPLYGYNWEISEKVDSDYAYIWMISPENLYVIFEGNKGIGFQSLPKTIDLGSYLNSFEVPSSCKKCFYYLPTCLLKISSRILLIII
jgi:hypothetical protein